MNTVVDLRTPHPKAPSTDDGRAKVIAASASLKAAEQEAEAMTRREWAAKAKAIGKDARAALDNFRTAQAQWKQGEAERQRCEAECGQVEADLHALSTDYRLIDFPTEAETAKFERAKAKLVQRLETARAAHREASQRKGAAWNAELE
jgi:hypothetical protein